MKRIGEEEETKINQSLKIVNNNRKKSIILDIKIYIVRLSRSSRRRRRKISSGFILMF